MVEIVRLPRVLLATLCGMALGLAGAAMQGVFRNALAAPETTGASAAAAFGGVLALFLGGPVWIVVVSAFVFGFAGLVFALTLARLGDRSGIFALILAGVIVSAFFGAALELLESLADPQRGLPAILYWLLGSFTGATFGKLAVAAAALVLAGPWLLALSWRVNLLSLEETDAVTLGVNVPRLRWTIVTLVTLLVSAQVAVSGGVGFVGLVIPHLGRMLVGADHQRLLPASMLLGGIYLLAADDLARSIGDQEIPIGVLTALVGVPTFSVIFWRLQSRGWANE